MQHAIAAGDSAFDERIRSMAESVQQRVRYHTIELPDGSILPGLQPASRLRRRLEHFALPQDLAGARVLDIGAWDGWFTFECERRGASVVAVDCVDLATFREAHHLLGSRAEYLTLDVSELSAGRLGTFDYVLFFGVLYHLRHPLQGLEKVLEVCRGTALIESFVIAPESRSIPAVMEFYERAELGGQIDNWCGPSPACLLAMCRSAGFATAELLDVTEQRASVICGRHWPTEANERAPAPHLNSAVNNRSYEAVFHAAKDEYVCCYFQSEHPGLTADSIRIEIDGFGVPALSVHSTSANAWQANCFRPAALAPGEHHVSVRTPGSAISNRALFVVLDAEGKAPLAPVREFPAAPPELCSAELAPAGDRRLFHGRFGSIICYFRSRAAQIGAFDVTLEMDGMAVQAHAVSSLEEGLWQANASLPSPLRPGSAVRLRLGAGVWSIPVQVL